MSQFKNNQLIFRVSISLIAFMKFVQDTMLSQKLLRGNALNGSKCLFKLLISQIIWQRFTSSNFSKGSQQFCSWKNAVKP